MKNFILFISILIIISSCKSKSVIDEISNNFLNSELELKKQETSLIFILSGICHDCISENITFINELIDEGNLNVYIITDDRTLQKSFNISKSNFYIFKKNELEKNGFFLIGTQFLVSKNRHTIYECIVNERTYKEIKQKTTDIML